MATLGAPGFADGRYGSFITLGAGEIQKEEGATQDHKGIYILIYSAALSREPHDARQLTVVLIHHRLAGPEPDPVALDWMGRGWVWPPGESPTPNHRSVHEDRSTADP